MNGQWGLFFVHFQLNRTSTYEPKLKSMNGNEESNASLNKGNSRLLITNVLMNIFSENVESFIYMLYEI